MSLNIESYLDAKGRSVRKQLSELTNAELAMWADKLYFDSFETPVEHVKKQADEFEKDLVPF